MSILQTATTSFKVELLQAVHNFGPTSANTFKIALYTAAANIGADTTVYTTTGEVSSSGTGYTAGGNVLVISTTPTYGVSNINNITAAFISFATSTWSNVTFTCRGALIYNSTQGNKSVAVLDFGSDKVVTNDSFQITFPSADANSAIVRIY
jgi:hypothetical protein